MFQSSARLRLVDAFPAAQTLCQKPSMRARISSTRSSAWLGCWSLIRPLQGGGKVCEVAVAVLGTRAVNVGIQILHPACVDCTERAVPLRRQILGGLPGLSRSGYGGAVVLVHPPAQKSMVGDVGLELRASGISGTGVLLVRPGNQRRPNVRHRRPAPAAALDSPLRICPEDLAAAPVPAIPDPGDHHVPRRSAQRIVRRMRASRHTADSSRLTIWQRASRAASSGIDVLPAIREDVVGR